VKKREEEVDLAELLKEIEEMENEDEKTVNEVDSELTDEEFNKMKAAEDAILKLQESETSLNEVVSIALVIAGIASIFGVSFGVTKAQEYAKKRAEAEPGGAWDRWRKELIATGKDISDAGMGGSGDLEEAYSTIETLKSELNEINLLNAKLLYTNKIFKSKTLNESQKVKVLSSFDKAKNVGEVKMVFETLNEGIKVSKNTINENLGRASKGTIAPNVKKPIVESNEAFLRMQKLAGII
jgi:Zn-dependent M16 (insulinase) family peptidase